MDAWRVGSELWCGALLFFVIEVASNFRLASISGRIPTTLVGGKFE